MQVSPEEKMWISAFIKFVTMRTFFYDILDDNISPSAS